MQSSLPSTSKAAFNTDPALADLAQSDGGSVAAGTCEPSRAKKTKTASKDETSLLERLLRRLQDNRLQSGDPETARKLQEINRSQNASNIILKKILNIAFITTGVALLLSVIFVIVYTSIVKHSSKDDDRSSAEIAASNGEQSASLDDTKQLYSSSGTVQKSHVREQQPLSPDTVIVRSKDGEYFDYFEPRLDESSSSSEGSRKRYPANTSAKEPDALGGTDAGWGVVTRCRVVPVVNEGELKMGKMCSQKKDGDNDDDDDVPAKT